MHGSFELKNKRVTVVGLGLTGQSCVRFLQQKGALVSAMDSRTHLKPDLDVPIYLGAFDESVLLGSDLVLLSPGVDPNTPAIQKVVASGKEIIGDVELFARFNTCPVIAITGSNGKSTVTTLVTEMLKANGQKAVMGGNIGTPVLQLLNVDADILVLELSSFQLETLHSLRPLAATILNLSDDHLDRHGTMENYLGAKQRVYTNAANAVVNRSEPDTRPDTDIDCVTFGLQSAHQGFGYNPQTQVITLDGEDYLPMSECRLTGTHNVLNIQAAAACAQIAGAADEDIKQACREFTGLSHRFETVSVNNNIHWINDSKATNVGATVAAINGLIPLLKGKLILIAGGDGKGADFTPLKEVFESNVAILITLGKDGPDLAALKTGSIEVCDLEEAVREAANLAEEGDAVLLSPACASLDMFSNYQQRGDCFVNAVKGLAT